MGREGRMESANIAGQIQICISFMSTAIENVTC